MPRRDAGCALKGYTPHFYEVIEAPFEFLCVVPNAPDRIDVLD